MIKAPSFVIDCSVAMTWCFNDESTAATDALLDRLRSEGALVPAIWPLEIANVLIMAERRNRITQNDSAQFVRLLSSLPISVDYSPKMNDWNSTLMLGRSQKLTSYDAAYLKLAVRTGLPLATQAEDMIKAANALNILLL